MAWDLQDDIRNIFVSQTKSFKDGVDNMFLKPSNRCRSEFILSKLTIAEHLMLSIKQGGRENPSN